MSPYEACRNDRNDRNRNDTSTYHTGEEGRRGAEREGPSISSDALRLLADILVDELSTDVSQWVSKQDACISWILKHRGSHASLGAALPTATVKNGVL